MALLASWRRWEGAASYPLAAREGPAADECAREWEDADTRWLCGNPNNGTLANG